MVLGISRSRSNEDRMGILRPSYSNSNSQYSLHNLSSSTAYRLRRILPRSLHKYIPRRRLLLSLLLLLCIPSLFIYLIYTHIIFDYDKACHYERLRALKYAFDNNLLSCDAFRDPSISAFLSTNPDFIGKTPSDRIESDSDTSLDPMRVTPQDLQAMCLRQQAMNDGGLNDPNTRGLEFREWEAVRGLKDVVLPILMPVATRPEFLKRVLEALEKVRGINETMLIISQDLDDPEITKLVKEAKVPFRKLHLRHSKRFWGIPSWFGVSEEYSTTANILFLLEFAFDYLKAPGAIILESDVSPSVDFYDYFRCTYYQFFVRQLHRENGFADDSVTAILGHQRSSTKESDPFAVEANRLFMPWGWATTRKSWNTFIRQVWTPFNNWDITLDAATNAQGRVYLSPALSRTQHIGVYGINFKPGSSIRDVFVVDREGVELKGKRGEDEMRNVGGASGMDDGVVCPKYELTYDI